MSSHLIYNIGHSNRRSEGKKTHTPLLSLCFLSLFVSPFHISLFSILNEVCHAIVLERTKRGFVLRRYLPSEQLKLAVVFLTKEKKLKSFINKTTIQPKSPHAWQVSRSKESLHCTTVPCCTIDIQGSMIKLSRRHHACISGLVKKKPSVKKLLFGCGSF